MTNIFDSFDKAFLDNYSDLQSYMVQAIKELVAVPTVNVARSDLHLFPYLKEPGQESLACEVLGRWLDGLGIGYEVHEGAPMRGNLIARWGEGTPELLVALHLDVVPPGELAKWEGRDPFVAVEEKGRLVGRGVMDNKGPIAAVLVALKAMKLAGIAPEGTLTVAGIASEEFHAANEPDPGVGFLLSKGLIKPDMALVPDVGENMTIIDIAEKGRISFVVEVEGKDGHASVPHRLNANMLMAEVLSAINRFEFGLEPHPLLGAPTLSIGIVRGGEASNTIPKECRAWVDVRYIPGQTAEGIRQALQERADKALQAWGAGGKATVKVESDAPPHAMEGSHPMVGALGRACEGVLAKQPAVIGIGGGTFAKGFNLGGIPAVGFGPGDEDQFHVAGESVSIEELMQFARVAGRLFVDLLGCR